jgi:hypothetical protein
MTILWYLNAVKHLTLGKLCIPNALHRIGKFFVIYVTNALEEQDWEYVRFVI